MVRISIAGLAALAMIATATPASASVDEVVRHALALERGGRMAEAYALLSPLTATRAGDPDFDYALGVAATDSGHVTEAVLAFQRVLSVQPGNAQARAEIARAYARLGDAASARAQFDTVLDDPSLPDPVRQRFNRIVRDLDRARDGGTTLSGFGDIQAGYDSNINTATGLTQITLPLLAFLGPATLGGPATRMDSGFVAASAGVSVRAPLSPRVAVFASVLGDTRNDTRTNAFDQASVTGTGGLAVTRDNHDVVSLSGQVQQFWLSGDDYRTAYGATGQYTHRLAGGRALTIAAQWFRLDYATDPLRDANRYTLAISRVGREAIVSLDGGVERTRRVVGSSLSYGFVGGRYGIEKPLSRRIAVTAALGVEGRFYDADDPLFLKTRSDVQIDAALGAKLAMTRSLYLRPLVTATRNVSNIDLYDYRRVTASLGIHADF